MQNGFARTSFYIMKKNMENTLAPGKSWDGNARKLEIREDTLPHNPRYP
jgi:hypothetical protein